MSLLTEASSRQAVLTEAAIELLKRLIATPSFSREEDQTALLLEAFLTEHGIPFQRKKNNIWAYNEHFDPSKPTVLLNIAPRHCKA